MGGGILIQLQNIHVNFPENSAEDGLFHAVKDVSLNIETGDIYGIVGYSGAGKSTVLRVINQLQKQSSGNVIIDGNNISELSDKKLRQFRKNIGMIFQHFNLLKQLTVAENIAFPLQLTAMKKNEITKRVLELLDLVDLKSHKDYYPSQLSGGQRQRVSIARALANNPKILLCDEATSALDPKTTDTILQLLKKINQELGITIVLITHEMSVIKKICDRVAVMQDGRVIEEAEVFDIFSNPQAELSKEFIKSASPTEQGIANILARPELLDINAEDKLIRIDFAGKSSGEPLIAKLARDFEVFPSILYGNVEIIQEKTLGTLLVSLKGNPQALTDAIKFVASEDVSFYEYNI